MILRYDTETMALLLGLDIGTTSMKCVLYDADSGQVVRAASRPTPVDHPRPGWSEHDPLALWHAAAGCIREAAQAAGPNLNAVAGLAVSSMAEAGALVDAQGRPLSPIIAWYDRRSEPQAAWVEQQIGVEPLYRITGQRASPSFGVTKLLWLRGERPDLFSRGVMWQPVPAYLMARLCGQPAVDYTIAARTLLFDQRSLTWSAALCETFGLDLSLLPPVYPGGTPTGSLSAAATAATGLPPGIPCVLGGHDHLCASLAAGAHQNGAIVDSTGSASALLLLLPRFLPDAALAERSYACYAYVLPGLFALKGGLKAAGSALEWLAQQLSGDQKIDYAQLEAAAAPGAGRRAGPLWLPHLIGSGAPEGDRFSSAAMVGVQFEHDRGDLFRGMLESMAFWLRRNLDEMRALTGAETQQIRLIGGVTRLRLLSQLKADALNQPVFVPLVPESAAVGAALLAGIGAGVFANPAEAVTSLRYGCEQIDPIPGRAAWYESMYQTIYRPLYDALRPINRSFTAMRGPDS